MTQFTISITDNKAKIFLEFMKNLSFVKKIERLDSVESFDIPQEHKTIVRNRIKKSEENPEILLDWDDVSENFVLD